MKKSLLILALCLSACTGIDTTDKKEKTMDTTPAIGAYMIVQGKNYNAKDLGPYSATLPPIYEKFGGHYVAFSTDYVTLEGKSDYQATVISAWPSVDAAKAFWASPEYEASKKLRDGIGDFDVIIVPALPGK